MVIEMCRCQTPALMDEGRCAKHTQMMTLLYDIWMNSDDEELLDDISDLSDGYGEDSEAFDWSGIRDSSVAAVEDMYERALESQGPIAQHQLGDSA